MGSNNSVNIAINLDRMNPFFYAGESVSGTVNVNIKEGHIKVDELFIELKGETGYTTTHTIHESNGSTRTETHYHTITFFLEKMILESSQSGKKELVYHSGQYSWRFDIQLPPQLPPTINESHRYPRARYYLRFVIDKPWYKRNKNETLYLTVFPRVNLLNNPQCLMSSIFGNHNRKDVTLKGNINKLGYVPGEMITGTLEIENPRKILLKQIFLSLIQYYQIECNAGKETVIQTILPTIVNTKEEYIMEKFSLAIPITYLAPSYEFHSGFKHTAKVHVNYFLEFDVKAEGMFTNFGVSIPITLATEYNTNPNEHQLNHATNLLPNSISYYPEAIMHDKYPSSNF
ncbi:unnamed protein product [Rotaria sordida]|uniref:Arrestin C-terminal-like domain-containing protein n=1 Tax=Rotaria sordida TaxID=392033 RepID=A0A814Q4G1_9BILA|nr:unnamed protein product [Rotaria sordida]CAF1295736.1 unnamed protein product [Rotaria sordida]CAF3738021.1 unnamed protein product [Rotaria sordida]CAF3968143.1 unnamed protein product [Rotaria sordida]